VPLQCIVVSALKKTSKVNTILKVVIFKHSVILFRCILPYKAWYQGKIKMSAISKEMIKIRVLTKIQDIWTE
jgi:hypothetical protein